MPDRICGQWTIGPGGYFEGDPNDPSYVGWHVNGPALHEPVEVVPVPDEQAIERAAKLLPMFHPDDAREMVRAIAAALGRPE